ncbi:hypothetical protein GCM10025867_49480 (plasmid) [Frondihabitans sucicola]|uniref:DUF4031 domain-containing protein n=1 Tax=Frondihabitans sucicola TaxID=1268041 RepID=A0ABM8GW54_9MICO|nr:DUF4031 domain-containing protein [Frondihabitans sucicola]BDZ52707.1 hypothetical protein GCM10025867_49480 [Frondihabitans sucicola]
MSVYVDDMLREATVGPARIKSQWSHLIADSPEELLKFARKLGLNPMWIQHPGTWMEHFDLTLNKRARALQLGALPIAYPHETGVIQARVYQLRYDAQENPGTLFDLDEAEGPKLDPPPFVHATILRNYGPDLVGRFPIMEGFQC